MTRRLPVLILSICAASSPAWAQFSTDPRPARPATATYWGDTGLWFVPTAEVVRPGGWSLSVYRTELDFKQGVTDVSDWPVTFAFGAGARAEIFGALRVVTRIDRDLEPLFEPGNPTDGGLVNNYPFVRETWTGNDFGDLLLGAKFNLLTERVQQPFAMAFRGTVKLPTADFETGAGTGEADYFADLILSKEAGRSVELTGFTGWAFRGDPTGLLLSDGLRWGFGAAFGARANLRFTTEIFGEWSSDDAVVSAPGTVTGADGTPAPIVSQLDTGITTAFGLTWQHSSGMLLGAGVTYQFGLDPGESSAFGISEDTGSAIGMQFRIGFHRGVGLYRPPAPPPIAAAPPAPAPAPVAVVTPPPAPPAANRPPTLSAQCNPCRIEVGRVSAIRADAQDPDGDQLTYRWATKSGTIADPRALATNWTAETVPSIVPLTVTVDDGRGGVATATVNVEVVRSEIAFEDVQFDLDEHVLRPDALLVLDRAVTTLMANPTINVLIAGHCSEEATEQYNLALGERRAQSVRAYLVSRGIAASRLGTVSFGESQPKYDNSREETRALNRRAALSVEDERR